MEEANQQEIWTSNWSTEELEFILTNHEQEGILDSFSLEQIQMELNRRATLPIAQNVEQRTVPYIAEDVSPVQNADSPLVNNEIEGIVRNLDDQQGQLLLDELNHAIRFDGNGVTVANTIRATGQGVTGLGAQFMYEQGDFDDAECHAIWLIIQLLYKRLLITADEYEELKKARQTCNISDLTSALQKVVSEE